VDVPCLLHSTRNCLSASRRVSVVYCGERSGPSLKEHGFPFLSVSSSAVSRAVLPMLNGAGLSLHSLAQHLFTHDV
jgi:hypothetical protein